MERVRLDFEPGEYHALVQLAEQHLRPLDLEVRYLVRAALQQAGLLPQAQPAPVSPVESRGAE